MRRIAVILLSALATVAAPLRAETRVIVTIDRANLRPLNTDNVESVGEVVRNQQLVAWGPLDTVRVPVEPPDDVSFWIYAELVRQGRVVADKAQIRSGAGLAHKAIGSVDRGTPVESRGRLGDWLKIAPPSGFPVWISRSAIALAPTSAPPGSVILPPEIARGLVNALADTNAASTAQVAAAVSSAPPEVQAAPPGRLPP